MLADAVRRSAGVHFTSPALVGPSGLAASIRVGERFRTGEVVLDPACGAGAFLVATARYLWLRRALMADRPRRGNP